MKKNCISLTFINRIRREMHITFWQSNDTEEATSTVSINTGENVHLNMPQHRPRLDTPYKLWSPLRS